MPPAERLLRDLVRVLRSIDKCEKGCVHSDDALGDAAGCAHRREFSKTMSEATALLRKIDRERGQRPN